MHARNLAAKIASTTRWQGTRFGRNMMGTAMAGLLGEPKLEFGGGISNAGRPRPLDDGQALERKLIRRTHVAELEASNPPSSGGRRL